MNKPGLSFGAALIIFTFISCSTQNVTEQFPYGSYSYQSFNIVGDLIGEGSLYITRLDSNRVEGNWSIRNVRNCFVCGPQYGNGYLTGRIENDSMYINLNPDKPENYVELAGELNNGIFTGDWVWFELIVNSNRGTFRAVKM